MVNTIFHALFAELNFLVALLIVPAFVAFAIGVGVWFVIVVNRRTGINRILLAVCYFVLPLLIIWWSSDTKTVVSTAISTLFTFSSLAPEAAIIAMALQWLIIHFKPSYKKVGTLLLFLTFGGFFLGSFPVHQNINDKLDWGPTITDIATIDYDGENAQPLKLFIPRPYFDEVEDKNSAHPRTFPASWLSLCYPAMTPWNHDCAKNAQSWKLKLDLQLWDNNSVRRGTFTLWHKMNLETLSKIGTYPEIPVLSQYPSGLRAFLPPETDVNANKKQVYYVPIDPSGADFYFDCRIFQEPGIQCHRVSVKEASIEYSYVMPEEALSYWPTVEQKIATFIDSLNSDRIK